MNVFIDTEDIEERYTEQLYQDYLEKENKILKENNLNMQKEMCRLWKKIEWLKERVAYLERSNNRREETIIYLRNELVDYNEEYQTNDN